MKKKKPRAKSYQEINRALDAALAKRAFVPTRRCRGGIAELADKCTEGRLTPEERDEYEALMSISVKS